MTMTTYDRYRHEEEQLIILAGFLVVAGCLPRFYVDVMSKGKQQRNPKFDQATGAAGARHARSIEGRLRRVDDTEILSKIHSKMVG